ncbi:MAG: hypothetical protein MK105_00230 [Crocinitomicaceae bacterium]|nr:hypothetical protein [Crocinitomicaceae bacterium]
MVYPEIDAPIVESFDKLEKFPSEDNFWKTFFSNGAKNLTKIVITSNDLDVNSETIKALNSIENLAVRKGESHLMEFYFDDNKQGETYDLRPELPLIIHL